MDDGIAMALLRKKLFEFDDLPLKAMPAGESKRAWGDVGMSLLIYHLQSFP